MLIGDVINTILLLHRHLLDQSEQSRTLQSPLWLAGKTYTRVAPGWCTQHCKQQNMCTKSHRVNSQKHWAKQSGCKSLNAITVTHSHQILVGPCFLIFFELANKCLPLSMDRGYIYVQLEMFLHMSNGTPSSYPLHYVILGGTKIKDLS